MDDAEEQLRVEGNIEVVEPPVHSHFGPPMGVARTENKQFRIIYESEVLEEGEYNIEGTLVEGTIRIEDTE